MGCAARFRKSRGAMDNQTVPIVEKRVVALWGASQVGKTTTLAAYFGKQTPAWIDQSDAETRGALRGFREIWDALRRNQLVAGTTEPKLFSLRHRDGRSMVFRDMKGGQSRYPSRDPAEHKALFEADAALVFC